jgi:PAS domain S-box-containing protein
MVNRIYAGLGWWLLGSTLWALGVVVLPLAIVPSLDFLARIGNPLIVLGSIALYIGVMRFLDRHENRWGLAVIFLVFVLAYYYFMYGSNSISLRTVALTATSAVTSWMTAAALFLDRGRISPGAARFTALVFFIYGCFLAARLVAVLVLPPIQSYSDQQLILALAFVVPIVISMLATFGFTLMVNQRLSAENREERDRLQLTFDTSPDAVMIARLADGLIVDVNAAFLAMSGYARAELIGNTLFRIGLWQASADRESFVAELRDTGVCENNEVIFRRKDGSPFTGSISAKIITLHTIPHVISVVRDNTEREKAAATSLKLATLEERARLARASRFGESVHSRPDAVCGDAGGDAGQEQHRARQTIGPTLARKCAAGAQRNAADVV